MVAILHQPKAESSAFAGGGEGLIAIKVSGVTYQWAGRGGKM